jgi:large subunit ribosomal protein L4
MITKIYNLNREEVGELKLKSDIFGLEIRQDIVKLVVEWQLAKARAGTHQTKTISQVSGTTKKPFKQKGTGNARQGSLRSCHMRGGGVSHGPVQRSHAFDVPKKVRRLAMCHILSAKFAEGKLIVVDDLTFKSHKTKEFKSIISKFTNTNVCIISGNELDRNLELASRNVHTVVALPTVGANVYDILRKDVLIMSKEAIVALEGRLLND